LPGEVKTALQRAASQFGWKDPATVWLASQAVLSQSPTAFNSGTVVKRARATLRALEEEQLREPRDRTASAIHSAASSSQLVFDDDSETGTDQTLSLDVRAASPVLQDEMRLSHPLTTVAEELSSSRALVEQETATVEILEVPAAKPQLLGEATQAAGLVFLLNVLRSLGIVRALEFCPELAEADLATHILRQLATEAGVAEDDPILLCLGVPQEEFTLPAQTLTDRPTLSEAWPKGFTASRRVSFDSSYLLRVWTVAAKRWCWRMGRLTLGDVVNRHGRVWLTRTDLDVTFSLAAADLRIRRIGLDIDPGWLPWFGESGRVVRFHYRDREPEESC
jgi:hypothetical protein